VESQQAGRLLQHGRDVFQGNGRSVRSQDRAGLDPLLKIPEQSLLRFEILEYGFNDDIGPTGAGPIDIGHQPALGACDPVRRPEPFCKQFPGPLQCRAG